MGAGLETHNVNVTQGITKSQMTILDETYAKVFITKECCAIVYYNKKIFTALPSSVCEATSEGLVRYPTTLAPVSGSVTVSAQCADNAHRTSSSLSVQCSYDGIWSYPPPECECNIGFSSVYDSESEKDVCMGKN